MYIIVRRNAQGSVIASHAPHIHHTYENAVAEAKRLSAAVRGFTFIVMKSLDKEYFTPPPPPIVQRAIPMPPQPAVKAYAEVFN